MTVVGGKSHSTCYGSDSTHSSSPFKGQHNVLRMFSCHSHSELTSAILIFSSNIQLLLKWNFYIYLMICPY